MKSDIRKRVPLTGYVDRLSARPGEKLEFKLSVEPVDEADGRSITPASKEAHSVPYTRPVNTWLTQSICADPNPAGPGILERVANQWYEGTTHQAKQQFINAGSYGICHSQPELNGFMAITLSAKIWPTLHKDSTQCIISFGSLGLCISADNTLSCQLGERKMTCEKSLRLRQWVSVSLRLEKKDDVASLTVTWKEIDDDAESKSQEFSDIAIQDFSLMGGGDSDAMIMVAAQQLNDGITNHFNGKIETPELTIDYAHQKTPERIAWDFSKKVSSSSVPSLHDPDDELVLHNSPARAMTGSNWKGQEMSWRHAPELYGAIHFHDDDLIDADWETTFSWHIPPDMPSGVYVMRMSCDGNEDAIPFYICPPEGKPGSRLCVLIPIFTYAIYGNHARPDWEPSWQEELKQSNAYPYNPAEYPGYGLSTYNNHSDGSGICHASHCRPLFNLRPGYITFAKTSCSGLRHFQADSHLLAWLDAHDIDYDIITDRELQNEGVGCIKDYDMLMTATHPEYHTSETLDALCAFKNNGGHLSYLGGNGFYWRIALHPENTDHLEIRRAEDGIRAWAAEPGEYYQAFDGQYGGLWRRNGRPPQALCGLGFSAQGQFNGSYYRKRPLTKSMQWILDGIDDEIIGDFGLSGGGAAGFELDRADTRLGTPETAHIIATSENHGDDFILVPEEMLTHITTLPGTSADELLHADIIWFDIPGGGSVFSVGSITFCGSLPHNDFNNSVSQLLLNVVRHVLPEA